MSSWSELAVVIGEKRCEEPLEAVCAYDLLKCIERAHHPV